MGARPFTPGARSAAGGGGQTHHQCRQRVRSLTEACMDTPRAQTAGLVRKVSPRGQKMGVRHIKRRKKYL